MNQTSQNILTKIANERFDDTRKSDCLISRNQVLSSLKSHSGQINLIGEIKRASPSKGDLAKIEDPLELLQNYKNKGAKAISVLTEPHYFKGSFNDLKLVSQNSNLPVLMKDFITSELQIVQGRAFGASIVLLIAELFDTKRLQTLYDFAISLGLSVLVETHSREQIAMALEVGAELIGINVRDLKDFSINQQLFEELVQFIPDHCVKVAESGVKTQADLERYQNAGADAVLVGEALVKNLI
jgi:indole-3-glycerol phosphate synthase